MTSNDTPSNDTPQRAEGPGIWANLGIWIAFGVPFGLVAGLLFDNVTLGIALGPALGLAVGIIFIAHRDARGES